MKTQKRLLQYLRSFSYEPLAIHRRVDAKRRLPQQFHPDFPLLMHFYSFPAYREMLGENWLNWHEHLELILPVSGSGRFRSGDQLIDFHPGDLLLVDNLKMHGMVNLEGEHQSLVIFFKPELVYNPASCRCDAVFLAPFFERADSALPILRAEDGTAERVNGALHELVVAYFGQEPLEDRQATCKLHLLGVLLWLRRHFEMQGKVGRPYGEQKLRVQRLKRVFDFLHANCSEKLRLGQAAAMVGMSETQFKSFFKKATGTTFAQYVIHLRLARAAQLLRDTNLSMTEIAQETGFCDQSHFDHRFKDNFRSSPKEYRNQGRVKSRGH